MSGAVMELELTEDEQELLESELNSLTHAEEIKRSLLKTDGKEGNSK